MANPFDLRRLKQGKSLPPGYLDAMRDHMRRLNAQAAREVAEAYERAKHDPELRARLDRGFEE
jgi:hypothetical protein